MTVSTEVRSIVLDGNGSTTVFPFSFPPKDADSIQVSLIAADGTITLLDPSTYTVSVSTSSGSVTYPVSGSALPSGQSLLIERTVGLTQETDLPNQGAFFASVHEDAFDLSTMRDQQQQAVIDRTFTVPKTEAGFELALAATRAGKVLSFDDAGAPETTLSTAGLAGLIAIVDLLASGDVATVAAIADDIIATADNDIDISLLALNMSSLLAVAAKVADGTLDTVVAGLEGRLARVSNLTALRAVTPVDGDAYHVASRRSAGDGGGGVWIVRSGDFSTEVANDPAGGIWQAFDSDPDGDTIVAQRLNADLGKVDVRWFGAVAGDTIASTIYADLAAIKADYPHAQSTGDQMDWLATQAAINAYPGRSIYFPGLGTDRIYRWNRGVVVYSDYTAIVGDGFGQTLIYFSHPTDDCLYIGPQDPVAISNLTRCPVKGIRIACIASNPTGIGIEQRQCNVSDLDGVHLFGFGKSILVAGGTGNRYRGLDARCDDTDTPSPDSYVMKFVASDRGVNGWQPTYSHTIESPYFDAAGLLDCVLELGMGDNLQFIGGYWKGGVRSILIKPDGGGFGFRAEFANVYQDGQSSLSQYAIHIPPFNEASQNIGQLTFTGGLIANFPLGSHLKVEDPTAGGINFIKFVGTDLGNCGGAAMDVTNTARDLNLVVNACTIRDCGGGIRMNGGGSLIVTGGTVFEDVRDDSGVAHIDLAGTINSVQIGKIKTKRLASGGAALLANAATIQRGLMLDPQNTDNNNARDLRFQRITIADNAVAQVPISIPAGGYGRFAIAGNGGGTTGEVWFRADGATQVTFSATTPIEAISNSSLSGTSGTDGRVTLSYDSSTGLMNINNRLGTTQTFEWQITA